VARGKGISTANLLLINLFNLFLDRGQGSAVRGVGDRFPSTHLDKLERGDGRQSLALRIIKATRRMARITGGDPIDDALRSRWPVGRREGEAIVRARIQGIQFNGHRIDPGATHAELRDKVILKKF